MHHCARRIQRGRGGRWSGISQQLGNRTSNLDKSKSLSRRKKASLNQHPPQDVQQYVLAGIRRSPSDVLGLLQPSTHRLIDPPCDPPWLTNPLSQPRDKLIRPGMNLSSIGFRIRSGPKKGDRLLDFPRVSDPSRSSPHDRHMDVDDHMNIVSSPSSSTRLGILVKSDPGNTPKEEDDSRSVLHDRRLDEECMDEWMENEGSAIESYLCGSVRSNKTRDQNSVGSGLAKSCKNRRG